MPRGKSNDPKTKKKQRVISIKTKKEIVEKHEKGVRVAELCRTFNMSSSTICTILKKKEEIKNLECFHGISIISKRRLPVMDKMEMQLLTWVNEKQAAGDSLSESLICQKAKELYGVILDSYPDVGADRDFRASKGWFHRFKKRSGMGYVSVFEEMVLRLELCPNQIFTCGETGLFWKKLPSKMFIIKEEKNLGHQFMKDRLTLLLCANASGDFKLKPMLVYHSETPCAFVKHEVTKEELEVFWENNERGSVNWENFLRWLRLVFCPSVQEFLEEKDLPLKALLLLGDTPVQPHNLQDVLSDFPWLTIEFIPPNITSILQPMDQQIIDNFKKLYTKVLIQKCCEVLSETQITVTEFLKNHYNIYTAIGLILRAWDSVTERTLKSAWKKLWPSIIWDFENVENDWPVPETDPVVSEIIAISESLGLEIDATDIEELVNGHNVELTTEELQQLHQANLRDERQARSVEEEEKKSDPLATSSANIKEMLSCWEKVKSFFEETHPDKELIFRCTNYLNDLGIPYYKKLLKKMQRQMQKQTTTTKTIVKKKKIKREES